MKSKQNFSKKNNVRSSYVESADRLKPVKSKSGKSNKRISIYDDLDDEFDESESNAPNPDSIRSYYEEDLDDDD